MDSLGSESEIVHELRKLQRSNYISLAFALLVAGGALAFLLRVDKLTKGPEITWGKVRGEMEQGRYEDALKDAKALVDKAPKDYYAHASLAGLYRTRGELAQAEKEYEVAYALWPSEDNEKALKTIKQRIESERK